MRTAGEWPDPPGRARQIVRQWLKWAGPASEGVDDGMRLIERARDLAASAGFRELGPTRDLIESVHGGLIQWHQARAANRGPRWGC